jgi:hypothetical protein
MAAGAYDAYYTPPTANNNFSTVGNKESPQYVAGPAPRPTSPLQRQYDTANTAIATQAQDYSGIMDAYRNLLNAPSASRNVASQVHPVNPTLLGAPTPYQAQMVNYQPSADVTSSLGTLKDLSSTGGYDAAGIADLRARGISPIRAVYANAQQNLNRQKRLQGGYSPGYTAASAKMAREQSSLLSDKVSDINADIAQNVASNRINIAPQYASAAGAEDNRRVGVNESNATANNRANEFNASNINDVNSRNASSVNDANRINATLPLEYTLRGSQQDIDRQLESLRGMTSLYGTNPALVRTFGDQAMNSTQLQAEIMRQNQNNPMLTSILNSLR